MLVNGRDCTIVIKTSCMELDVPYTEETIREAVSLLYEAASIEGDGISRTIRKSGSITGCVVTPLHISTAPLLLCLAMGAAGLPVFVSETRNLYQYRMNLLPVEDSECFDLIQDRGGKRRLFEDCHVHRFELRFLRGEAVKLKLDVCGSEPPVIYPHTDISPKTKGERFHSDFVSYQINGKTYTNIYGLTLSAGKEGCTKTELWIRRALEKGEDLPETIEELIITANLFRDGYELYQMGMFRITAKRLVLVMDETDVNCADAVIAPVRYYVSGMVTAEVYTAGDEAFI